MNRLFPRSHWFCLVAGLFAGVSAVLAAPPSPTPPEENYAKRPDPPVDPSKDKALYTVGYAHLDTQWRWSYPQVVRDYVADTLHSNFKLFEKYPNYVFNFSGSRRYEMMREYYPEDYAKLKEYVAAGRWFPCGSSVDEADANVPSLESFVRHVLYGNRYFEQEFGKSSSEFMLPDCFGFPASLPEILAHCGVKGFSTQKLTWGSANGIPFKVGQWLGPDGRSVVAALDPGGYGDGINEDLSHNQNWLTRINKTGEMSGAFVDYHYYGTGDRGGAPTDSAVHWLEQSLKGNGPLRVVSSTAERMFNDLTPAQIAKLPTYKGELLLTEHSAGSITSEAYMKRWNRKNELLADAAERASVGAMLLGGAPYPSRKLYEGWDLLLGSQMHDMLPGTSLPKAYEYCWNDEILAANHFAAAELDAVGAIASTLDTATKNGGTPFVVYNPLAQDRDDLVEATVTLPADLAGDPKVLQVFGPDGHVTPAQVLERAGRRVKILFQAHLPSVGFATYELRGDALVDFVAGSLTASEKGLENARYRVSVDANGDLSSVFDKKNKQELLTGPARLEFHYEKPKKYPAWNMDWTDRQKPASGFVEGPASVRVIENGPVRVALEVVRESRGSRFVQQIRLAQGAAGDRVEIANVIDWQTPECSLKAAFTLANPNPQASYDDKVGVVVRGNNDPKKYEVPQHEWFDLTGQDGKYGVAVLNDSKFGSDKPDDKTMRLTLLYTPGTRDDYQDQGSQDFGRHEILYAITGHAGDWRAGNVSAQAACLNQPLASFQATAHPGQLGRTFSLLKVNSDQVEVAAIKKAEASDEIVVRLRELHGTKADGVEIAGGLPIISAREINGQEKPVGPAAVSNGKLSTHLEPFGLHAFALKFGTTPVKGEPVRSQAVTLAYDLDAVSSQKNRADGGFDHDGVTYPAEQFPKQLQSEGVDFRLGPTADGQKNALVCRGQTVDLPEGDFDHVYLLAAAHDGDTEATFKLGDQRVSQPVQDWSAFVGQWDNRLWKGNVPELTYAWHNELDGLVPGFIKSSIVAWYASHRHHPQNGNQFYQYCYLFKYGFPLPAGTRKLTLPDNPKIAVFAVSVAKNGHEGTTAARPLYDTLSGRGAQGSSDHHRTDAWQGGATLPTAPAPGLASNLRALNDGGPHSETNNSNDPQITPRAESKFHDSTLVTLQHPLYWRVGGLHYTTDGSTPTTASPVYTGPIRLSKTTDLKARMISSDDLGGSVAVARFDIEDTTPPSVLSASSLSTLPQVTVRFSEPVSKEGGENPASYRLDGAEVKAASLSQDACTATLALSQPLAVGGAHRLTVTGIKDLSPAANTAKSDPVNVTLTPPTYQLDNFVGNGTNSQRVTLPSLPTDPKAPWTVNFFVKTDKQPENRTLIAGFGEAKDDEGHGRYLSKFANGIHFWCANQDVETGTKLAVGKWQMLSATFDGQTLSVYQDAHRIGQGVITPHEDEAVVELAPVDPWDKQRRFVGEIRAFTVWNSALDESALQSLQAKHP